MKYKELICGIIIGTLGMTSITALADGKLVEALVSDITFKFDGVYKIPSGKQYSDGVALNYNGRLYVQPQFLVEEFNADAEMDYINHTMNIVTRPEPTTKESTTEESTLKERPTRKYIEETTKSKDNSDYRSLPIEYSYAEMDITATLVQENSNDTRIYLRIKNKSDSPLYLKQSESILVVDGKDYYQTEVSGVQWSSVWDNNIEFEEVADSYITFRAIPEDTKNLKLRVVVLVNDYTQKEIEVPFYINLN